MRAIAAPFPAVLLSAGALVALAFAGGAARAETVKLENGSEFSGWIVEEDDVHVVLAIIRNGAVGTLRFSRTDIESIGRERTESLEQALIRERERLDREARAREEAARASAAAAAIASAGAPTSTPPGVAEAAAGSRDAGDTGTTGAATEAIAPIALDPLSDVERKEIEDFIFQIGQSLGQGQGSRRAAATSQLIAKGPKAIAQLVGALGDGSNSMRRMNAATAIAGIAAADPRLGLYLDAAPKLVARLDDPVGYVRQASNQALENISGERFGAYDTQRSENPWFDSEPSKKERETTGRWQRWWAEQQDKIDSAKEAAATAPAGEAPASGPAEATGGTP